MVSEPLIRLIGAVLILCFQTDSAQYALPERTALHGKDGGLSFDDSHIIDAWGRIRQITIRHDKLIDGIGVAWENGFYRYHGGDTGEISRITLEADEWITRVYGRTGVYVDQLVFESNLNRTFGPFGTTGGISFNDNFAYKPENVTERDEFEGNDKYGLLYIFGRSGELLDSIGFGFGKIPESLNPAIIRSEPKGGDYRGEIPFDDLTETGGLLGKIQSITVVHNQSKIFSISTSYLGSGTLSRGGTEQQGHKSTFRLRDDEYITKIEGLSGRYLYRLKFFLNSGRVSPTYGGDRARPFTLEMDDHVVKSFFGRTNSERIVQLGVTFEPAKVSRYEIFDMAFIHEEASFLKVPPLAVDTVLLVNPTDVAQTVEKWLSVKTVNRHSTSILEHQNTPVNLTFSKAFDVPIILKDASNTSSDIRFIYSGPETSEEDYIEEREEKFVFRSTVPPQSKIRATCVVRRARFNVPWTARAQVTYTDQFKPVIETVHGVLEGISVARMDVKYESLL